ncbi:MAG TPA: hypothetical protein VMB74_08410 [Streptosporangiaceae bacterium]|nr:hypothetical protein [Streptosporangiaceae bacterium]
MTRPATVRQGPTHDDWIATLYHGSHALDTGPGRVRLSRVVGVVLAVVLLVAAVIGGIDLSRAGAPAPPPARVAVQTRQPASAASVLSGSPAAVSAGLARLLLASAPSAVVADAASTRDVTAASAIARRVRAPLLLMSVPAGTAAGASAVRSAIKALGTQTVLTVGVAGHALTAGLPRVKLVTSATALPSAAAGVPQRGVAVLVHVGHSAAAAVLDTAAAATAQMAGARVVDLPGFDPQTDPAAISELAAARPSRVIAVGARFGSVPLLTSRLAVAETGVQLPGGGQVLFPMRRIVALYGNPGTPALGALGEQDLAASISRARSVAAQYSALSKVPVIPAFEIIATVAERSPGPSGTYSDEMSVAALRPWVRAATKAGMYVTLDLQPGRANFLAQARHYQSLLRLPDVGLALDPEWKLGPHQLPLHQIGSVGIAEVNSVVTWLARLTAQYRLPQKLLELHEFRLTMIGDIRQLDTRHQDLAVVINMDGQGAPSTKQQTWAAVVAGAPSGVFFGWKDFYVKDTPMLGPRATLLHEPQPMLISYQ